MKNSIVITIIVAVVVGAGAFFGGMQYQKMQATANFVGGGQFGQGAGAGAGAGAPRAGRGTGRGGFGNATMGKIVSQDANSITVQLQDGSSKIVNVLDTTTVSKMDTATKSDLTTGQTVAAFGTTNSDGSINATRIQLNPMMGRGPGAGANPGAGGAGGQYQAQPTQ